MIQPQELRIGNWVEFKEAPTQIDLISIYNPDKKLLDAFSPIPLTPEWLERFGFGKSDQDEMGCNTDTYWGFYYNYHFRSIKLEVGESEVVDVVMPMEYVHQLQNLYYALTGKELEIKNPT